MYPPTTEGILESLAVRGGSGSLGSVLREDLWVSGDQRFRRARLRHGGRPPPGIAVIQEGRLACGPVGSAEGRWPVLATGRFVRPLTRQNHHSGSLLIGRDAPNQNALRDPEKQKPPRQREGRSAGGRLQAPDPPPTGWVPNSKFQKLAGL